MFIILLMFSSNRDQAGEFMAEHNAWLQQGFNDSVFVLAGGIQPGAGGCVIATNTSADELKQRVSNDPFVRHNIVSVEILEINTGKADERLAFLAT